MEPVLPGLAGQKGLRGEILLELKRSQPLTAKELAEHFGVSANAVRRHLKELEFDALVVHSREQRGTGAPTHTFRLGASGEALFPTQYRSALSDVLSYVARHEGRAQVKELFAARFRHQAEHIRLELADKPVEQRLNRVVEFLTKQGFMAEVALEDGSLQLAEHNCAIRDVAEEFPEICEAEADFLREVLQRDVTRECHIILDGCNSCRYAIAVDDDMMEHHEKRV